MSLDINIFSDIYGFSYWLWSPGWIVLMLIQIRMISQRRAFRDSLFMDYASTHPEKVSTATLSGYLRFLAIGYLSEVSFSVRGGAGSSVLSPHLGKDDSNLWDFFKILGERALCPFLGFSWTLSVDFQHSDGTLSNFSGEKLHQSEVYQKINQLTPHCQFYLEFLWRIQCLKSKGTLGPFHSECPSLPYKRLSSFVVLRFQPRAVSVFQSSSSLQ